MCDTSRNNLLNRIFIIILNSTTTKQTVDVDKELCAIATTILLESHHLVSLFVLSSSKILK